MDGYPQPSRIADKAANFFRRALPLGRVEPGRYAGRYAEKAAFRAGLRSLGCESRFPFRRLSMFISGAKA
ncbi:hypothetical protein DWW99_11430 [[Clostridium] leptum]|nr:hypothetical protein DWW99_11430 [[Clostridium] leptum]